MERNAYLSAIHKAIGALREARIVLSQSTCGCLKANLLRKAALASPVPMVWSRRDRDCQRIWIVLGRSEGVIGPTITGPTRDLSTSTCGLGHGHSCGFSPIVLFARSPRPSHRPC